MNLFDRVKDAVVRSEQFPPDAQIRPRLSQPFVQRVFVRLTSTTKTDGRYPAKWRAFDASVDPYDSSAWSDGIDSYSNVGWVITPNNEALTTGVDYEAVPGGFGGTPTRPVWIVSTGGGVTKDINYYRQVGTSPFTLNYSGGSVTGSGWTTGTFTWDEIDALPLVAPRSATIDAIRVWLQTAGGTDARLRLAIYEATSDTNLYPSALLVQSAELNAESGAPGYLSDTISATLAAGKLYWLCVLAKQTSAGSQPAIGKISSVFCHNILGISNTAWTGYFGLKATQSYGSYPSTFPSFSSSYLATGDFGAAVVHFSA